MPPPRKEGDAVESVKDTPVSQNHDSKVDSDMQPWTDSIVDEAPNGFDSFGEDFGVPMDNLGGGMDFDNNVDSSLTGGWGAKEVCNELLNVKRSLQNCR
jgi:phosphoribosylformylglycinamidine (FGAM) synthase-like enzyme